EVERLAREHFTYLKSCKADLKVIIGDARLSMENEPPQNFDLLVMDAFSSDSVPLHLLTKEAFEIYLKHIKPEGVIAFHISSLHLDLNQVIWKQADCFNLKTAWIESEEWPEYGVLAADWILLTKNEEFINNRIIQRASEDPEDRYIKTKQWTDDHSNIFQIFK
ncbi:MAG: fused MFS/spermidine synthase, partial [Anaerohalosphaera sp.]|nr:fused MFS/spermidine synthase [Anaerohalosphaera sp.]